MKNNKLRKSKKNEYGEEISDIIERMPTSFGRWVIFIVILLVACLILFGWFIKYPDTVSGRIVVNAQLAPVKLIANTSGKLNINGFKPQDKVSEGDYIAFIQNPANTEDVIKITNLLENFNVNDSILAGKAALFPPNVSLGELNLNYYTFIDAFQKICNYQEKNTYQKQEENLLRTIAQLKTLVSQEYKSKRIKEEVLTIAAKTLKRDSAMRLQFASNAISESEIERTKMEYLTAKDNYQNINKEISSLHLQIDDTQNKLEQLRIEKEDREKQMRLNLLSAYNDLGDNIKKWEQKYVFKAPFGGKVEFLKFWTNNQFAQDGEEVFAIIPDKNEIIGQVKLPAKGAGKVKTGCEVIIKLDNYPYMEYGSINGIVRSISLTASPGKTTNQDNSESYLVLVDLPNELTTNYGSKLEFKYEIKGTADIITNDRRLMQRLFDNLHYQLTR